MENLRFMHPLIVFQGRFQGSDRTKAIAEPNSQLSLLRHREKFGRR